MIFIDILLRTTNVVQSKVNSHCRVIVKLWDQNKMTYFSVDWWTFDINVARILKKLREECDSKCHTRWQEEAVVV